MQFLIFADLEYNGFVINIYDNLPTAKIVMNKVWELGNPPTPFSLEDLSAFFIHLNYRFYKLTKENMYYEKTIVDQSNGFYTVGIVELNDDFTVEDYLNSRGKK